MIGRKRRRQVIGHATNVHSELLGSYLSGLYGKNPAHLNITEPTTSPGFDAVSPKKSLVTAHETPLDMEMHTIKS